MRANPKLSGTKNNVFGIQTGVAISFLVKRKEAAKAARIFYARRPEMETAEDKLSFLSTARLSALDMESVKPDAKQNWLNLTDNDFDSFIPIASKETKAAKTQGQERAIFKLISLGVVTARDEWVYADSKEELAAKVKHLIKAYNSDLMKLSGLRESGKLAGELDYSIKWTRAVKRDLMKHRKYIFDSDHIIDATYRPFFRKDLYFSKQLNEMQYRINEMYGDKRTNRTISTTHWLFPWICLFFRWR